ncbi:PREDICTED: vitellogenin-like [Habropoda laboriosa]|nr:PREDICTED: vitellogenin-like [Habropoda laboriosa]
MWLPLSLIVLAGIASADYNHGWKVGNEYTYLVRSRTLTSLELSDQYTGILIKALLTVHAKDQRTLTAKLSKCQYARVHNSLPEGWESHISDQMLDLQDLPLSGRPFEIRLKHGVIKEVLVERDIPTWEVNMLKSVISQLQVDSQGENVVKSKDVQVPNDQEPYGSFRVMEDSVGGKCEVLYDVTPLTDRELHMKPELVPVPQLKGDGQHIDIMKTKNFKKCDQRMNYHFGISGSNNWEPGSNDNGKFLSKSSTSRVIISGDLKTFTIQSSVTTSKMFISPRLYDYQNGVVVSRMNLTLGDVKKIKKPLSSSSNLESIGNLVYVYDNPFSDVDERRINKVSLNSKQTLTSDSLSSISSSEEVKNKEVKNEQNLRSVSSASASSSSSSISSSEENTFWQPKPTLEDAPQNPLLPNFIGYQGKFIGKSGEVDVTKAIKELVFQIANELEDPSNMPNEDTLDKFTVVCSLIRTMSRRQISQMLNTMHFSPNELKSSDKSQAIVQNAWAVFRDAIAQAGTGPALLIIKNWIEKKEISVSEAEDILYRLPKTARTPTAEYVKVLFELATNPTVKEDIDLSTAALISFADLVRLSQVNTKSLHNRYPVHTFGRLTSKHDQTLVDEYIPHLERELKKVVKERDSRRIQMYVIALGKIGHPKIVSVLEPYIEGKEPVTVFQRTLMVAALGSLAENSPKLARSILYKIYLNTAESHEVRCTAVFLLMKTNPPLNMLQRMAQFTNIDTNMHVNSAVKSTINSLAKLIDPQYQELAQKARAASGLLTTRDYSSQFSHSYMTENINKDKNIISHLIFNYIGSDDSFIPRTMYLGWFSIYGDFKIPPTVLMAMISSVVPLRLSNFLTTGDMESSVKLAAERIAEELNLIADEPIPFEGNVQMNTKFRSGFITFDRETIRRLPSLVTQYIMSSKGEKYMNMNKLQSYDVTLGFPTETGLPFVYTFRVPILYKISGTGKLQLKAGEQLTGQSNMRLTYAKKIQGRVGFVAPFEHQHFIAGVDVNFQAFAPVKIDLDVNIPKRSVQLKVWPLKGDEKARLIHYSVIPYTSNHDILSLRPLIKEKKNTHKVLTDDVVKNSYLKNDNIMKLDLEADTSDENLWTTNSETVIEKMWNLWKMDDDKYCKMDLSLNLRDEQKDPVVFTVAYDTMDMVSDAVIPEEWTPMAKAVEPSTKAANSKDRRDQYLKEAAKGVKSAQSYVVDVQLATPGEWRTNNVFTFARSTSNMESKARTLIYWHSDIPAISFKNDLCTAIQRKTTPDSVFPYHQAMQTKPKAEFDVDLRYGESCANGKQLNVMGKAVQSDQLRQKIKDSLLMKECEKQMEQDNKILKACQTAAAFSMILDKIDISIKNIPEELQNLGNLILGQIGSSEILDVDVDLTKPQNAGKKNIDIKAKLSDNFETATMTIHTPIMDIRSNDIELSDFGIDAADLLVAGDKSTAMTNLIYDEYKPVCIVDVTRGETFDGKEYPLRLGNCWHVVMTTYPKVNPENREMKLRVSEEDSVSILSREMEDGHKEVKIMLGKDEILLQPRGNMIQVLLNGQSQEVNKDRSYQKRRDKDVIFEIFKLGDQAVGLVSDQFEVDIAFDGKRIMIKAFDKFRNSIRGLCGNFDGDMTNDFTSPKNCMLRKPQQFVASYALTKDQCEDEILQIVKSIDRNECVRALTKRPSNVINEVESGRAITEWDNWGYSKGQKKGDQRCSAYKTKVLESDENICFSTRPVYSCSNGCSATEMKSKNYQFHCMKRGDTALNLKRRIEKGANPDLTQKTVSMSHPINVPLACKA